MTFHWYGLLIGLGIVGMGLIIEKFFQRFVKKVSDQQVLLPALGLSLLGALIGARLWHVVTSWASYQHNYLQIFDLPAGGLSILGGLVGGISLSFLFFKYSKKLSLWPFYLDALTFGLPLAQIFGRLGNFINQELYGYPSKVWWAIPINFENRSYEFANYSHFHPLFLYEILALVIFLASLWSFYYWGDKQLFKNQIGKGKIFLLYLVYYLFLRFFLDFIRIDKALIQADYLYLGLNQVVIFLIMLVLSWPIVKLFKANSKIYFFILLLMSLAIIFSQYFSWSKVSKAKINWLLVDQSQDQSVYEQLKTVPDHSLQKIALDKKVLTVEIVNTPASITQGLSGREQLGSDGMLFVLPQKRRPEFWMKQMKFDLDLVWLVDDLVIEITQDATKPEPNTPLSFLERYSPSRPVEMVLELNANQQFLDQIPTQKIKLLLD